MLLGLWDEPSFMPLRRLQGWHQSDVQRCSRGGRGRGFAGGSHEASAPARTTIIIEPKRGWWCFAGRKAKELVIPQTATTRLLSAHARRHGHGGHAGLARLAHGTVRKISLLAR